MTQNKIQQNIYSTLLKIYKILLKSIKEELNIDLQEDKISK